ncbi:MAG: HAMP domain-containing histidine kinase [Thermoproteota archaeon]|nr:HAMP domain-containing histidine kinase [Thermoproteota archaeon]
MAAPASPTNIERTEVFYGSEDAMKILLQAMRNVKKEAITCSDAQSAGFSMTIEPVRQGFIDFKKRGLKIRSITEITKENLEYCKQLGGYVQLRHLDGLRGNFAVSETEYVATAIINEKEPVTETIYSNAKAILEQHRYFFETLWNKAIPAEQRIRELEQGVEREFVEVITDGARATQLFVEFASSVRKEAQLILSQPMVMERTRKLGMWDLLIEAANNGAQIRVISPITNNNEQLAKEITVRAPNIKIFPGPVSTAGMFIVDNKRYFRAEDKDPEASEVADAISVMIYSNNVNGVKSFKSLFEILWQQLEMYEKLSAHNAMQREFINIAAHELRTPIQALLGIADLIESKTDIRKEKVELSRAIIEMMIRNVTRLERLSANILDASRIESNTLKLNKEVFDLNQKVLQVIDDLKITTYRERKNIKIVSNSIPDKLEIYADKSRIFEVLSNLIRNSIRFSDEEEATIIVNVEQKEGYVVVEVRDNGRGIDPEIMPKLFTKFATKSYQGIGLGLYISKSIVEAHGGKIWAENNRNGKGATFTFTLPVQKPHHG